MNACKHFKKPYFIDPYSSAAEFNLWRELLGEKVASCLKMPEWLERFRFDDLAEPTTWLLNVGWTKGMA